MINLIPKEERKKINISFYYKIVVLFFTAAGLVSVLAVATIIPSYLFSSLKNNIANTKLEEQKGEPVPSLDQQSLLTIKDLSHKLDIIESSEKNKFLISKNVISAILSKKMSNIKIINISYGNDDVKGRVISIQGNAPSREVLLSFRKALEDSSDFKQVDLPISNFVKGSNIQFYLSLIPS